MARIQQDNILWILCCCGGLPIIGLIKGLLTCIPIAVGSCIGATVIAVIMLPHDVYFTYYTILKANQLGPNITALAMLLLPIPLALWPVLVSICSLVGGLGVGLVYPIVTTFEERSNLFVGGMEDALAHCLSALKNFWKFNSESYFLYLREFREDKSPGNEKWDIRSASSRERRKGKKKRE